MAWRELRLRAEYWRRRVSGPVRRSDLGLVAVKAAFIGRGEAGQGRGRRRCRGVETWWCSSDSDSDSGLLINSDSHSNSGSDGTLTSPIKRSNDRSVKEIHQAVGYRKCFRWAIFHSCAGVGGGHYKTAIFPKISQKQIFLTHPNRVKLL